jgi:hypothetical protein
MGEVKSIFADGRLHRQLLNRIAGLELTSLNGQLALRFTLTTRETQFEWLMSQVAIHFIVNAGERTLVGRCTHYYGFSDGPHRYAVIEFRDQETGQREILDQWRTLEIVLKAGEEEKRFETKKAS